MVMNFGENVNVGFDLVLFVNELIDVGYDFVSVMLLSKVRLCSVGDCGLIVLWIFDGWYFVFSDIVMYGICNGLFDD